MTWLVIIEKVFEIVIWPLLAAFTAYAISYIKTKINNATASKYLDMANETIYSCVLATKQTFVDTLKAEGKFDEEAQKKAFDKSFEAIKALMNIECEKYLQEAYSDMDEYIKQKIEATINNIK